MSEAQPDTQGEGRDDRQVLGKLMNEAQSDARGQGEGAMTFK